jgi:hypothetical protein
MSAGYTAPYKRELPSKNGTGKKIRMELRKLENAFLSVEEIDHYTSLKVDQVTLLIID